MLHYLKELGKDTIVYGLSIVIGRFLTFLLTPLYTHYLTPSELGGIAFLYSLLAFLNIFLTLGMESAFFRYAANQPLDREKEVFSNGWLTSLVAAAIAIALVWIFAHPVVNWLALPLPKASLIVRLSVWIAAFDSLLILPFAHLRLHRKTIRFSLAKTAIIVVNVALNVWFLVGLHKTAEWIIIANVISSGFGFLLVLPIVAKLLHFRFSPPMLRTLFRFALPTIPAAIGAIFLHIGDRPLLKIFASDAAIGIYQANYRLAIPMLLFISMFEYAWKPFFLRHYEKEHAPQLFAHISLLFTTFGGLLFLLLLLGIDFVVRLPVFNVALIDPRYWEGTHIVPIVAAGYLLYGFTPLLLPGVYRYNKTSWLASATGFAALTNVVCNILLIPLLGYTAAAWATVAAYLTQSAYLYRKIQPLYPIPFPRLALGLQLGVLGFLWLVSALWLQPPPYPTVWMIIAICIFALLSALLLVYRYRHFHHHLRY